MAAKVLMITRAYRSDAGGMERFSRELAYELARDKALNVTVLAHRGSRRTSPLFTLAVIPRALVAAASHDVIHLGDPMLSLVGWLIKKMLRKPVAVTVHGLDIRYSHPLYQVYLRVFFRSFDLYLPISTYVASLMSRHRVAGRLVVINPSVSDHYYDPAINRSDLQDVLAARYTLQTDTRVLLTVGRLVARKGHAWFISNVLNKLPKTFLYIIAGDGPEQRHIAKTARDQAISDRVIMLGKVSDSELRILYNTIDAFVQPNLHLKGDVEGFGLVLLEAALCSRSVIAAKVDGIPDAIQHEQNGWLVSTTDTTAWQRSLMPIKALPEARSYTLRKFVWPRAAEKYRQELVALTGRQTTVLSS